MPATSLTPARLQSVREAFEQYVTLYQANDPRLADLYADNAVIRTSTSYPDGQVRDADVTGEKWKARIRMAALTASARQGLEPSTFSRVREAAEGEFVMVRAERYGRRTCYRDELYYQVYGRRNDGAWLIVQERLTTVPVTYCAGGVQR